MLDIESCDGANGYIEVPSCIELLANSAGQLRQLAHQACQYYARTLLCYGYTGEPSTSSSSDTFSDNLATKSTRRATPSYESGRHVCGRNNTKQTNQEANNQIDHLLQMANDKSILESMSSTVQILPFLNELSSFIERCLATVESTIKRITYYLNLASQRNRNGQNSAKYDDFQLACDVRIDAVFVALMDLMFALINLDKTLQDHTNIRYDLNIFQDLLQKLISNMGVFSTIVGLLEGDDFSKSKLSQLNQYIHSISVALGLNSCGADTGSFSQCIDRVQHLNLILSKDKTQAGFKLFHQIFEEFLIFYSDHLVDISAHNINCTRNNPKVARTVANILIGTNLIPTTYMTTLSRKIFGLASLSVLFHSIFHDTVDSKKIHRAINRVIQRTKPCNIILVESTNSHLFLDEFLLLYMPKSSIETKSFNQLLVQMDMLQKTDVNLEFERLSIKTIPWLIKLKKEALDYELMQLSDWPRRQLLLLDQGLRIASEIETTVRNITVAQCRSSTIRKHNLVGIYKLSILLKFIQVNMEKYESFISTIMLKIEHFIRVRWRQLLIRLQKRQISLKYSDRKMDLDSALKLSSLVAQSELLSSNQGRIVQSVCLSMLLSLFDQNELQDLNLLMDLIRPEFFERLKWFTDCKHLYWHIPDISIYYNHAFEESNGATNEVSLLHLALVDIQQLFAVSNKPSWSQVDLEWLFAEREKFFQSLSSELIDQFKDDYLDRICQELAVELRLQTHKYLYSSEHSETPNTLGRHVYDFKQILAKNQGQPRTFHIFSHRINLNYYVEQYLNKVCYELTALAPHDWLSYDNMMNFARHKYGLKFVDTQLPVQTLDSGIDLLDITRNLALFASRYSYDLTNQLFIEKCSSRTSVTSTIQSVRSSFAGSGSNQLLNTIQNHHITQSIQAHGYGMLDSAVNCTYQTLKRLINLFSRQLSDDKLRAVLQKAHQQVITDSKSHQKSTGTISFDKANSMAKQFRLNISILSEQNGAQNQSQNRVDMDSIRQTVTQIGNLLAFVRLIKSGALTSASKSVDYVPDMDDLSSLRLSKFVDYEFSDYETQKTLLEATKNFDQCLDDYQENFSPKTNYSKIIVSLFSGILSKNARRSESEKFVESTTGGKGQEQSIDENSPASEMDSTKPDHLELFFLLIPALTINYIDHLINCKERASSRSSAARFGALLSDDGFAIGVAFLLTVLGQTEDYNKLGWLKQTSARLRDDINEVEKRLRDPKYEESLKQTSSMTLRRLNKLHLEYVALDYTLACALLLFENFS